MLAFESIRCIMGKKLESWHLTPINAFNTNQSINQKPGM